MRPKHRVVAVEPFTDNMALLCRAATLNNWAHSKRLTLVQGALSDRRGQMNIFVPAGRGDNADLFATAAVLNVKRDLAPEKIRVVDGDRLLRELGVRPDVIKIDTQGHELHVLRGLRTFLSEARHVLVIAESDRGPMRHSGVDPHLIWKMIVDDLGYSIYPHGAKFRIVENAIKFHGVRALTEAQFPPEANLNLCCIRTGPICQTE